MMVFYTILGAAIIIILSPVVYAKMVLNSGYILLNKKREHYPGENVIHFFMTGFLGPLIIAISIAMDTIIVPSLMMKSSNSFEHKYYNTEVIKEEQITQTLHSLEKVFFRLNLKGQFMTMEALMLLHRKIFKLIDNLHDLICRGSKDYKEALRIVQDYNMSKLILIKQSTPHHTGVVRLASVELEQICNVYSDIELYNFADGLFRLRRADLLRY